MADTEPKREDREAAVLDQYGEGWRAREHYQVRAIHAWIESGAWYPNAFVMNALAGLAKRVREGMTAQIERVKVECAEAEARAKDARRLAIVELRELFLLAESFDPVEIRRVYREADPDRREQLFMRVSMDISALHTALWKAFQEAKAEKATAAAALAEAELRADTKAKLAKAWEDLYKDRNRLWRDASGALDDIGSLLAENGCDCGCDHPHEEHNDECERCLACQIAGVHYAWIKGRRPAAPVPAESDLAEAVQVAERHAQLDHARFMASGWKRRAKHLERHFEVEEEGCRAFTEDGAEPSANPYTPEQHCLRRAWEIGWLHADLRARYDAERAAHATTKADAAAQIERERKRADSYLEQQLREAGWRPSGDDLDTLCATIMGGLNGRGLGATELFTVRTLRAMQRDLVTLHAAATEEQKRCAKLVRDEIATAEGNKYDVRYLRWALKHIEARVLPSPPAPPPPLGPDLYTSSNGEAGDASVHCCGCDEERDDPHTYEECISALRADRERESGGRSDAEMALEAEMAAHLETRAHRSALLTVARHAPHVIESELRRTLQETAHRVEKPCEDSIEPDDATPPTNGSPT